VMDRMRRALGLGLETDDGRGQGRGTGHGRESSTWLRELTRRLSAAPQLGCVTLIRGQLQDEED
jgi:hypothetical protein